MTSTRRAFVGPAVPSRAGRVCASGARTTRAQPPDQGAAMSSLHVTCGALVLSLGALALPAFAQGELRVLHHFGYGDGSYPDTDLVADGLGSLYGMTVL